MTELELIRAAQTGDRQAADRLVRAYTRLAIGQTHGLFLDGADRDDLHQEALYGVLRAIRYYRPSAGTPFRPFVVMCVQRHLATCVQRHNALKHRPLSGAVRHTVDAEGRTVEVVTLFRSPVDVHQQVEDRDELARAARAMPSLSGVERRALLGVIDGLTYQQIDGGDEVKPKWVDNALQRARHKLKEAA